MERYGRVIQKLQKLLESERRQLRQVRSQYMAELGRRNELQALLLDSIEQAKQQYRAAESAYLARHPQMSQEAWAAGPSEGTRPGSAAVAVGRPDHARSAQLGTPGALCSRQAGSSRPCSAGTTPALAGPAAAAAVPDEGRPLGQAAWDALLADLMARQEVLELLFGRAFPDFMAESQELSGSSHKQPDPLQLLRPIGTCQLQQLFWGSQQQLQQSPGGVHDSTGLGKTSPDHSNTSLEEGLNDSRGDALGSSSSSACELPASCDSQEQAFDGVPQQFDSTPAQQAHRHQANEAWGGNLDACDSSHRRRVGTSTETPAPGNILEQQGSSPCSKECCTAEQCSSRSSPLAHLAVGEVRLGSCSGAVMPSFPARQPLQHVPIRRPRSGMVHQQPDAGRGGSRPTSAAPRIESAQAMQQTATSQQSPFRPWTAAGRLQPTVVVTTTCGWQPQVHVSQQRPMSSQNSAAVATGADKQRPDRPSSSSSQLLSGSVAGWSGVGPGRPLPAGSSHNWMVDTAEIAATFLSRT